MTDPKSERDRWLAQAENDLAHARHSLAGGFSAQCCFIAQQVAEKALKAVHYGKGARAVVGHSVLDLLRRLDLGTAPDIQSLLGDARLLDQYYIPTRYPNGLPGGTPFDAYTAEQAKGAIEAARRFVELAHRICAGQ